MNPGSPQKILIIDDNPAIHDDFRKILIPDRSSEQRLAQAEAAVFGNSSFDDDQRLVMDLDFAFQGREGVEKARLACEASTPFSVAFVDMRMPPGWDGLETIEQLWQVDPDIQVVICSAYSDHSWYEICKRLGHRDNLVILKKPFDNTEVLQLAVAFLEKWRLQRIARQTQVETERLIDKRTAQLQQAQAELRARNQQLQLAANLASLGYWSMDASSRGVSWSPNMKELFGVNIRASEWESMVAMFSDADQRKANLAIDRAVDLRQTSEFRSCIPSDEGSQYLHTKIQCELDENGRPRRLFGVTQDVSEYELALQTIRHAALHDTLTGLPNRAQFQDFLHDALRNTKLSGSEVGLVLLDLDNFKDINDNLGHPVGDQLLQQLSERLQHALGENDLAARLGGDEFALIVRPTQDAIAQQISRLLQDLQASITRAFAIDNNAVYTSFSAGVAIAPVDGDDMDVLLKHADAALYEAKHAGRDGYRFFQRQIDERIHRRNAIKNDLRKAITSEEFELYYQPIVSSQDNRLSCFEALLRWHHPELGILSPLDFVPLAEQTGLIVPLGKWVLKRACNAAVSWPEHISVAVNVSAVQFMHDSLVEAVVEALTSSGLAPERLELEITESIFLENTERNLQTLHDVRDMGVRVVIDDFGVGYSSLSYLRNFPFDKLKLDRSFVMDAKSNPESQAILRAVAGLGATLGLQTTAEGVEDEQLLHQISADGYSFVQGYVLGRPQPAEQVNELIRQLDNGSMTLDETAATSST